MRWHPKFAGQLQILLKYFGPIETRVELKVSAPWDAGDLE